MYIDPNTGGTLFQMLATLLALFSGFALLFSSRIKAFFARFRRSVRGDETIVDQGTAMRNGEAAPGMAEEEDSAI